MITNSGTIRPAIGIASPALKSTVSARRNGKRMRATGIGGEQRDGERAERCRRRRTAAC